MVYTVCHSQHSDQGVHYLPFSVWSGSTLFAILSSLIRCIFVMLRTLIRVYTVCYSQQSDWGLHCMLFSVWSGSTVFAILINLIRIFTICPFHSDQALQYMPFSGVWSWSTLFAILSKQYNQGLHCLPFEAAWPGSFLFVILINLIKVSTNCQSQIVQGLHYLPSSAFDWGLHYLAFFPSSIIKVFTICHSQQYDQGLYYFHVLIGSGSTLFAILSTLISVYNICHS